MKKKIAILCFVGCYLAMLTLLYIPIFGSSDDGDTHTITATTTVASDIVQNIVTDDFSVVTLMGNGLDPHSYQASAMDVVKMQDADIVVYCGLHLEGKMGELFELLDDYKMVVALSDGIDTSNLIASEDDENSYDPHFWFDPYLLIDTATHFASTMANAYPLYADDFYTNLETYKADIISADEYCATLVETVKQESRILITAHDAFSYFGLHYGFEILSLAGISTASEVGTADVASLADKIVENSVKAIFTESSISSKSIQSLQEAVSARGFSVNIGLPLYSDSLGAVGSNADTYIKALIYNVETIVSALA